MKSNFINRLFTAIASFSLLLNSLGTPLLAFAQVASESPTPTPTDTTTPTPADTPSSTPDATPTIEATATPTATPDLTPTPDITPTPLVEVTPTPTDLVTPTPTATDAAVVSPAPETTPTTPGPPSESTPAPNSTTPAPSPSATPEAPQEHGNVSATLLHQTNASTITESDLGLAPSDSSATLTTNKPDYAPTDAVVITGTGFIANKTYTIEITSSDAPAVDFKDQVKANDKGDIFYTYQLDGNYRPNYKVEILSGNTAVASVTFTDANPSANLDQYANLDDAWVNGNLGASKAAYFEGNSVPYRMRFDNLSLSTHTVIIKWDTTKSGKHAFDYLTSYDRTISGATSNPCEGVSGCSLASFTTYAIPKDAQVDNGTGSPITQLSGNFVLYGGTITALSAYSYPDGAGFIGDKSASITITFTASANNPVLAWGGHIADRHDWGVDLSAVSIPGSPYHMRLIDLDGAGGNQDHSLSADAVIFPASITIVKQATPEGSTSFPFTASPSPLVNFNLVDDGTSTNTKTFSNITTFTTNSHGSLTPLYTITENTPAGWSLNGINCSVTNANGGSQSVSSPTVTINLQEGENVTCTYTNTQQQAHLTLVKTVTNDNGGGALVTDWTLSASGPTSISGASGDSSVTSAAVNQGTYTLSESGPSGYTASAWSCVKNNGAPATGSSITLAPLDNATCTINNNDDAAHLIVIKHVITDNGGTAVASDFTMTIHDVTAGGGNSFSGAESPGTDKTLTTVGSYSVTESGPSGYDDSYSSDCSGTIALGETKTCTVTNDDIAPTLKLVKSVINNNGGTASAGDWDLGADGDSGFKDSGDSTTFHTVKAGVGYALSESGVSGYAQDGGWSCDGGSLEGNTVTLDLAENVTCTVTNNDVQPKLTVTKVVVNDNGGTKKVSDFPLFVEQTSVTSGEQNGFDAGTYIVSETGDSGYTETISGDCNSETGSITLNVGDIKSCTITNDDIAPTLTLVKTVVNDNGGNKVVSDFTLEIDGNSVTSGTPNTLLAGSHTASEVSLPGYAASVWGGDCNRDGSITLNPGDNKTCTITNDDIAPTLTLVKTVVNDNGGTKVVSDFPLFINGDPATSGQPNTLSANVLYTASETSDSGYSASSWGGDCTENGTITLAPGDNKTCTITNDDKAGTLIVKKVVINDNGGTLGASDFSFSVNQGAAQPFEAGGENDLTVNAGFYTVTEPTVTGYSTTYDNCSEIQVANGGSATCTITNNDQQGTLTIIKNTIGGDGTFDFTVAGPTGSSPSIDTSEGTGQTDAISVDAGTYSVTEASQAGWDLTGSDCGGEISPSSFKINPGEDVTCSFTNTKRGTVTVTKYNDANDSESFDENEETLPGWDITLGEDTQTTGNDGTTTFSDVVPGTYPLSEILKDGWVQTNISCFYDDESVGTPGENGYFVRVGPGEDVQCYVGNFSPKKEIKITKSNDSSGTVGFGSTITYTLTVKNTGNVTLFNVGVTDVLPGGFTYVDGSTTGATFINFVGNVISWDAGTINAGDSVVITYKASTASDLSAGTYTNFATCKSFTSPLITDGELFTAAFVLGRQEVDCNVADSSVTLGAGQGYGGNLSPQVLGASTELPATGNDTGLLLFTIAAIIAGAGIRIYGRRKYGKN